MSHGAATGSSSARTTASASHCRARRRWANSANASGARSCAPASGGAQIDHIELSDDTCNFVLCPGGAWDRSPCGTGTSAKLACLAAEGRLAPGEVWRQRSITGSVFEARYERVADSIVPTITGQAWVTAESMLVVDPGDPYAHGIRAVP